MANTIEAKNVEVDAWWPRKQLESKDRSKITQERKNISLEDDNAEKEAAELLQKIENGEIWAEGQITRKEVYPAQSNPSISIDPEIDQTIKGLNRPEAEAGLKQSYLTIQNDVNDMNNLREQAKSSIKKIFGFGPKKKNI